MKLPHRYSWYMPYFMAWAWLFVVATTSGHHDRSVSQAAITEPVPQVQYGHSHNPYSLRFAAKQHAADDDGDAPDSILPPSFALSVGFVSTFPLAPLADACEGKRYRANPRGPPAFLS